VYFMRERVSNVDCSHDKIPLPVHASFFQVSNCGHQASYINGKYINLFFDYIMMKITGNILTYVLQFLILMTVLFSIVTGNFFISVVGTIALCITFIPNYFGRKTHIIIPWEVTSLIAFALYLHIAGYSQGWYASLYPYYDKVAHFVATIMVGMIGFLLVVILHRLGQMRLSRLMSFFFILLFTMAVGCFWEIFEYSMDLVFGNRLFFNRLLQHGLDDTMIDLIFDFIGGLIAAAFGAWYLKKADESEIFDRLIEKGKEVHPRLRKHFQPPDPPLEKTCNDRTPTDASDGY
jgi:uncharacterized membrane protein YjdF